ncbi:MAG TPA: hypothetical protein VFV95_20975 [Vicinamibacterales bacterium]|nr:hypothetical protein [Vicinamibacterales bacterium]
MKVRFRRFTEDFKSWERMLAEVAAFATRVGRENLINISCSEFGQYASTATVVVWYWAHDAAEPEE